MKSWLIALLFAPISAFAGHMFHEPPDISIVDRDPLVTTRPAAPKTVQPASFAQVDPQSVTLSWEAVASADFYDVQLATDPGFYFNVTDERYFKETQITVANLKPGTHYFWRVAAGASRNAAGYVKGQFSQGSFVTSGTAPEATK